MPPNFAYRSSNAIVTAPHKEQYTCSFTYIWRLSRTPNGHNRAARFVPRIKRMGQGHAKAKQGGDQSSEKSEHKPNEAKELIEFIGENYDTYVATVQTFDEFYHAIFELIEMFCEKKGQLQYQIPKKPMLQAAFETYYKGKHRGTPLTKDEFVKISEQVIKVDSFTFGKSALDVLMFLFGAPVVAVLVKRIVPGLKSIPDDVVIPVATSGSVVYLAKTNKL